VNVVHGTADHFAGPDLVRLDHAFASSRAGPVRSRFSVGERCCRYQ
jgi:hypothetical protein